MYKIIVLLALMISFGTSAQNITGSVKDADGPLEFASVRLFTVKDSSVAYGIYTSEFGTFVLENVKAGKYYMKVSFTNFETITLDNISLNGSDDLILTPIQLEVDKTLELEGVIATGSLDVLKAGIDKKIYNVKDDISAKGGSVNDVLNNIPSIDIDQDGNISLRGDGNVTILIDGRPSGLVLGDGQNLLDALPANSIERVEVVTNPSAKYDPDGTSGIINIVMKKNKLKGFNGIVSTTLATGNQYEGNFALSYRNKRFNSYINYSFNYYEGYRDFYSLLQRDLAEDTVLLLDQARTGTDLRMGNTFVFGTDFFINDRSTIGFSATGSLGNRERTGDLKNELFDGSTGETTYWDRLSFDPRSSKNLDFNLNYSFDLKEDKGELSMVAHHSIGDRSIQGFYSQFNKESEDVFSSDYPLYQQLDNQEKNYVTTFQADYSYILKKINARIETGAKAILSGETLNTYSETRDSISGLYYEDTLANFDYTFEGNVYSIYGIFGQERGKFKYQGGLRGEYAIQDPQLSGASDFYATYINIFPSAHVKYEFDKKSEIGVSYSKRINRPRSRQLNPFTSYADPFNLRSGNPDLDPEYIDSYDISYSYTTKKLIFTSSVYHRRTRDVINRVKFYREDNTSIVTYQNIDKSISTGLELVVIYSPFKWWKNTVSFNGNYIDYINSDPLTDWNNNGVNWGAKYIGSFDFWKNTASFQINATYSAPRVSPQGIVQRRSGINLSVEKRLMKKRLSVGMRVTDVFDNVGFDLELVQDGVRQTSEYKWLTRRFFVTASYKFGTLDKKRMPKRRSGGGSGGD